MDHNRILPGENPISAATTNSPVSCTEFPPHPTGRGKDSRAECEEEEAL